MTYTVFVIEDHPVIRDVYRQLIARVPELEICTEATTGAEALDQLTRHTPDIILLDLMLPDIRGVALLKEIKLRYPLIPVIVISGEEENVFKQLALATGANYYIDKLHVKDKLVDIILEQLNSNN